MKIESSGHEQMSPHAHIFQIRPLQLANIFVTDVHVFCIICKILKTYSSKYTDIP
jgi:hypothetical protein